MKRANLKIYHSHKHLLITLIIVALPFAFLIFFSEVTNVTTGELVYDAIISLARIFIAYLIAALLGWLCAAIFYRGRLANVALPFFDVLQSFPTFAALPIAVAYLGPSHLTVIVFLIFAIIWPIFFSIISSLKLIRRDWDETVEISQLKGWNYLRYFLWPASAPGLIVGSIIGMGDGWEAMIATEIITGIKRGLGPFFQSFSHNTTITIFGILGFLILIFAINKIIWLPLLDWSHRQLEE